MPSGGIAYFGHITTFYLILKWTPKIVADMGFAPGLAAGVLVWANVGGALGGALFGLLTLRFGLKPLTLAGLLFQAGFGLQAVAIVMALGSLIAAAALLLLRLSTGRPNPA